MEPSPKQKSSNVYESKWISGTGEQQGYCGDKWFWAEHIEHFAVTGGAPVDNGT